MKADSRDLTKVITKDLEGKWVALSSDNTRVVGASEDLMALKERVGTEDVTYMKIPPFDAYLSFPHSYQKR